MDLEFDEVCIVDESPNTVLPYPRPFSKVERKKTERKPHDILSPKKGFADISFSRYRSASCKSTQFRNIILEGNEVPKRGSVYQSTREVTKVKDMGDVGGRRKIEFPQSSANGLSLGILDSLCSSDEDNSMLERNSSPEVLYKSESNTFISKPCSSREFLDVSFMSTSEVEVTSNSFLQISLRSKNRENQSAEYVERHQLKDSKCRYDPAFGVPVAGTELQDRDTTFSMQKSLPTKKVVPNSPRQLRSNCTSPSTLNSPFSPTRMMVEPFPESKSHRSSLGTATRLSDLTQIERLRISRRKTIQKSLLLDFSKTAESTLDSQIVKECSKPLMPCSPAHLHGILKLKNKHGMPFFEFSVKSPEDIFVAKTWKVGNALNWLYTFHACHNKRRANSSGWGIKEGTKESSMVGQMQVSCFLRSELKDAGALENSMETQFVLYDIKQARKDLAAKTKSLASPLVAKPFEGFEENADGGVCKLDETSKHRKLQEQPQYVCNGGHTPWEAADLHPNLESAAIVIQVALEKRESLKGKSETLKTDQPRINLHNLPKVEQRRTHCLGPEKVNVVTSSGKHSLPTAESPGPSRLLDRWINGGGCDCGGWDMGCPLVVFNNFNQCPEDHSATSNQQPWKLYMQGGKEKSPALRMTVTTEGEYEVDFHAQLTTLQAFSICVAILHSTEASVAVGQSRHEKLLQHDSLKMHVDEDAKSLIESVTEEKWKAPTSFLIKPPFSPISRA